jgi:hypothetical protein
MRIICGEMITYLASSSLLGISLGHIGHVGLTRRHDENRCFKMEKYISRMLPVVKVL